MKWTKRLAEIDRLRAKHGKQRPNYMPNLKVEQRTAPCGNVMAPVVNRRQGLLPGAIQFPVSHLHKQGYQLITEDAIANGDLKCFGGRKS